MSVVVYAVVSVMDREEQLYMVMSAAMSVAVFAAVSAAASAATSVEILVELSLERYAVGISHQAQLVLKS